MIKQIFSFCQTRRLLIAYFEKNWIDICRPHVKNDILSSYVTNCSLTSI